MHRFSILCRPSLLAAVFAVGCSGAVQPSAYPAKWQALLPERLRLTSRAQRPAANAFVEWKRAVKLQEAADPAGELSEEYDDLRAREELAWTASEVRVLERHLERNAEVLGVFRRGLEAEAAWYLEDASQGTERSFPSFAATLLCHELAALQRMHADYLAHSGRADAAIDRLLEALRGGALLAGGSTPGVGFLSGTSIEMTALDSLATIAGDPRLSAPAAERVLGALLGHRPVAERLADALATELDEFLLPGIARLGGALTETVLTEELQLAPEEAREIAGRLEAEGTLFKPEALVRALGESFEALLELDSPFEAVTEKPIVQALFEDGPSLVECLREADDRATVPGASVLEGCMAEILCHSLVVASPASRARSTETRYRAVGALYALRVYRDRRGALPARWADVTAAGILDAAPIDPYASGGAALGFDPDAGRVWSVGREGRSGEPGTAGPEEVPLSWTLRVRG